MFFNTAWLSLPGAVASVWALVHLKCSNEHIQFTQWSQPDVATLHVCESWFSAFFKNNNGSSHNQLLWKQKMLCHDPFPNVTQRASQSTLCVYGCIVIGQRWCCATSYKTWDWNNKQIKLITPQHFIVDVKWFMCENILVGFRNDQHNLLCGSGELEL